MRSATCPPSRAMPMMVGTARRRAFAHPTSALRRRLFLGADQLAVDQAFGDLDGVQRRAFAQIVRHAPQYEAVLHGGVLADAADVGGVFARRLVGRDVAAGLALVD